MRRWTPPITAAYIAFIGFVLLSPSADLPSTVVLRLSDALQLIGAPVGMTVPYRLEFVLNALMVVPIVLIGSLHFDQITWRDWTAWTFVASAGVETFQGFLLAGRSASFIDVTANTSGALLGALCVSSIRVLQRLRTANEAQSAP